MTFSSIKEVRCVEIVTSGDKSATEVRVQAYNSTNDTWENAFIAKTLDSTSGATNIIPLQEIESPSGSPSISNTPSNRPSSSPTLPPACPNPDHIHVELQMKTDAKSRQNRIIMKKKRKTVWRINKIPKRRTVDYSKCVSKWGCYQVILTDGAGNGIKNGFFSVTVDGVLVRSTTFPSGSRWKSPKFGAC
jgi:hypothetical protein